MRLFPLHLLFVCCCCHCQGNVFFTRGEWCRIWNIFSSDTQTNMYVILVLFWSHENLYLLCTLAWIQHAAWKKGKGELKSQIKLVLKQYKGSHPLSWWFKLFCRSSYRQRGVTDMIHPILITLCLFFALLFSLVAFWPKMYCLFGANILLITSHARFFFWIAFLRVFCVRMNHFHPTSFSP